MGVREGGGGGGEEKGGGGSSGSGGGGGEEVEDSYARSCEISGKNARNQSTFSIIDFF